MLCNIEISEYAGKSAKARLHLVYIIDLLQCLLLMSLSTKGHSFVASSVMNSMAVLLRDVAIMSMNSL